MSKSKSVLGQTWVPTRVAFFCLLFEFVLDVWLGREILILTAIVMPVPLFLLWISWSAETPEERHAFETPSLPWAQKPRADTIRPPSFSGKRAA